MLSINSHRLWIAVPLYFLLLTNFSLAQVNKRFTLLNASQSGIDFINKVKDTRNRNILLYSNFYGGAGVGVGDFNNDGLQDV